MTRKLSHSVKSGWEVVRSREMVAKSARLLRDVQGDQPAIKRSVSLSKKVIQEARERLRTADHPRRHPIE